MNSKFDVLVLSCDKYAGLIPGFIKCYNKNITSSAHLYFKTNTLKIDGCNTITTGNSTWSIELRNALEYIDNDYVLILLEDIYINQEINFDLLFEECIKNDKNFDYVKIINIFSNNKKIRRLDEKEPYRVNVIGFWNKKKLTNLILDFETPWEFEINGSYRSRLYKNVYELKNDAFEFKNMIEKGSYIKDSYIWAIKNDIQTSDSFIIQNNFEYLFKKIFYLHYKYIVFNISYKLRLRVGSVFKKILAIY